jgi:hypothetical protein
MEKDLNSAFTAALLMGLEETFEKVHGIYLDKTTSIFETLATISAEEASQAPAGGCATIAAHVAHMTYYMEILVRFIHGERPETDWQHIWQTVSSVTPAEWAASQHSLREVYMQIRGIATNMTWEDENQIGGALGLLAHNAYHLGEIRQMLCGIKADTG